MQTARITHRPCGGCRIVLYLHLELRKPLPFQKMCAKRVEPDIFYVSPAQRSIHTAIILIRELQLGFDRMRVVKRLYNASAYELLDFYEHEIEQEKHCIIIGHNPGISNFASLLSGESYSYPTMGRVTLVQKIEA